MLQLFGSIAGAESLLLGFTEDSSKPDVVMAEAPHGTAPALQGKNIANPMAMILAAASLLGFMPTRSAGWRRERSTRRRSRRSAPAPSTADLGGHAFTDEFTNAVIEAVRTGSTSGLAGDERISAPWHLSRPRGHHSAAPEVVDAMIPFLREPGAILVATAAGGARTAVDSPATEWPLCLGCAPARADLSPPGGTEADNLAIRGVLQRWGAERGRHVVVSAIEHEAVLTTATILAERGDGEVTVVGCDPDGHVDPEALLPRLCATTPCWCR